MTDTKHLPRLGRNLREWRQLQGLSQAQLAAELNVSERAVSAWENGTDEFGGAQLDKLLDIFDLTHEMFTEANWDERQADGPYCL